MRKTQLAIKQMVDIVGSMIGLIVLSPLFLIIAVAIKLDSEGPVFFKQERLGKDGRVFRIIKFRTMVVNAEQLGAGVHLGKDDDRITEVGRFLRKYSLDELPQLINVARGEMSLVGPRPLLPRFPKTYDEYTRDERLRFIMKPGMSGLAQVNGRGSLSWEEKFIYDARYVREYSLRLDCKILIKTVSCIIRPKGIYKDESGNEYEH